MKRNIQSLTGGRFFAMLLIVISHFEFLSQYSFGPIYDVLHNPALGVDYFFMLSGFGMMLSYMQKTDLQDHTPSRPKDLLAFAVRHIKKIYPLYLVALVLGIVHHVIFKLICNNVPITLIELAKIVIKIIPCLLLVQSATGLSTFSQAFCAVFWFLSCLFCIYLVSPLLMRFLRKHIRNFRTAIISLLLITASAVALVYIFAYIQNKTPFDLLVYASPYRRVLYVAYGMVLALILRFRNQTENSFMEYLALPLAGAYFFLRNYLPSAFFIRYSLDLLICGFALYSLVVGNGLFCKILSSKPIVYLGSLSMYVFIIHYLLRMYIDAIVTELGINTPMVAMVEVILIVVLSYGISAIVLKASRKTPAVTH